MKMKVYWLVLCGVASISSFSQLSPVLPPYFECYKVGTVPLKPFLICGNKPLYGDFQERCNGGIIIAPFCGGGIPAKDGAYQIYSPLFYQFKCYHAGTLGFNLKPDLFDADLDWQLYDITGKDPADIARNIYLNSSLVIAGSWAVAPGETGADASGVPFFVCKPINGNPPLVYNYSAMPELKKDHEYLLLIARVDKDSDTGFMMTISGTADITDPLKPHMVSAKADCSGKEITVKFNKKITCASLTPGSEFRITPGNPLIAITLSTECKSSNAFDEMTVRLYSPLAPGTYKLELKKGIDGNTLLDLCDNEIPEGENVSFDFVVPQPIFADSIAKPACMPDSVKIYFPKKISCATISPGGTDFSVTGPQALNIISAGGNCVDGKSDFISVKFDKPITTKGSYALSLIAGNDGSPIVDECGVATPSQTLNFTVADTVNADFTYSTKFGCQRDTLTFSHDAAHGVNNWKWIFNKTIVTTQSPTNIWPAKSTNDIKLLVSNGTCIDSANATIKLDNEVKAGFTMTDMICPEDKLEVLNETIGVVDRWKWNYDIIGTSIAKDPQPFLFPTLNKEAYYSVKLVAYNNMYNCSDSVRKTLTVLDHCNIGVATAFTPNHDGLNDTFWPHNALKADDLIFKVYNRYGQLVFQSKTWRDKWDGTMNGLLQPTGVYVWMLSYTNRDTKKAVFQRGTVTLIR